MMSSFKFTAFLSPNFESVRGLVAQWITRLTTDQKIPGSNPGKLESPILKAKWYRKIEVHIMPFQKHRSRQRGYAEIRDINESYNHCHIDILHCFSFNHNVSFSQIMASFMQFYNRNAIAEGNAELQQFLQLKCFDFFTHNSLLWNLLLGQEGQLWPHTGTDIIISVVRTS